MGLKEKLENRDFVILAEAEPPKGVDVSRMISNALQVEDRVDAFVVPEMSDGVMRMSPLGAAIILHGKGLEPVMQVSCRDRNRLALQGDLLAAHACGITNVMAVPAVDPSLGDHHETKSVYDIDLLALLTATVNLQQGRDMAGMDLSGSPRFFVGSTVYAGAQGEALDCELEEMNRRVEKGVRFFVTPPVFDFASIQPFLKRVEHQKSSIIPTVLLLKSVGMARYIERHDDRVHIPESLIGHIQKAQDRVRECIHIASEMASELKNEGFGGVLLSTLGWEDRIPDILEAMGDKNTE
jgi:5,10-methylenetetrahydrofolate reductase